MRLEIIKETTFNEEPWFAIYLDNRYVMGSYTQSKIDGIFVEAVKDPENFFKTTKEVLKSEEIVVPLQQK
jgi:hypothetical protein